MKVFFALVALIAVAYAQDCPAFNPFRTWTSDCLWFPLKKLRDDITAACGITYDMSNFPSPTPGPDFQIPERCGYCSFKFRCQKRAPSDGCFPINGEKQTCDNFNGVCLMPKVPRMNNCKWGMALKFLKQCINRPENELSGWERDAILKFHKLLPESNCIEKDGKCACCCHPYKPNSDGTACVKVPDQTCQDFGEWNDWSSECLWFPMKNIIKGFQDHCAIDYKPQGGEAPAAVPTPPGFQIPEKCGFCSFKIRCRKRSKKDAEGKDRCFPVQADKKACGPDDCPTCGNVCTLPKMGGGCDISKHIMKAFAGRLKAVDKMPYWRRRGMFGIIQNIPHGKCKEVNGECKCCCHPYEPNEEGTACVIKPICKNLKDLGVTWEEIMANGEDK